MELLTGIIAALELPSSILGCSSYLYNNLMYSHSLTALIGYYFYITQVQAVSSMVFYNVQQWVRRCDNNHNNTSEFTAWHKINDCCDF